MALSDSVSRCPDCVEYLLPANPLAQAGPSEGERRALPSLGTMANMSPQHRQVIPSSALDSSRILASVSPASEYVYNFMGLPHCSSAHAFSTVTHLAVKPQILGVGNILFVDAVVGADVRSET